MPETTARSPWLSPQLDSIAASRRFVEAVLAPQITSYCLDIVKLVVSELVTNAVIHARSRFVVQLEYDESAGRVRVEVTDRGAGAPVPLQRPNDQDGRGLRIVESLSSAWGWATRPRGKAVWCELECPERS